MPGPIAVAISPPACCLRLTDAFEEIAMKNTMPVREPEPSPSKNRIIERPDNGAKSIRGQGPSSGAQKDNPHKQLQLVGHGWLKR
jgi:hypothetical protein